MNRLIPFVIALLLPLTAFAAPLQVNQGGTASTTLTGLLAGNGTGALNTSVVSYPLMFSGHTLSMVATSSLGLTTSSFASSNISQWTNNSGYLTSETDPLSLHLTDWYATSSAPQLTTLANLATVGTISTGVWHGTPIADTYISSSGNWNTAYTDRITGANYPLSITSNVLSVVATSSDNCTVTCFLSHNVSQWTNDAGYLTANQTITLSGDVSGSGSTAITTAIGANKVTLGDIAQVAAHSLLVNNTGSTGNVVAVATSSLGLTTASFASANVSQWTNDAGYVTSSGVTSVGATYPILSSGGTTPVISTAISSSTLTASSPLTGSFAQVGSGGSLGCQTASGSQAGCLSSTDWTTFNNKGSGTVTSVTGTYPIQSTGGTTPVISTAFGTTTTAGIGNDLMLYTSHTGVIIGASTSTLNIGGNAGTATALQNARTINGVSFNGTANIVVASTTLLSSDNNTFTGNTIFVASTTHEAQVNLVGASSTLFSTSNLWDTALTSGDCVQASTNGLLTTTGSACGSGGGGGITALGNYATTTGTTISFSTSTQSFQGATFGQSIVMSTNGVLFTPIITGTLTAASSTLLSSDNNTFSGHTIFAASTTMQAQLNLQQASSTNFSASGTVYADNFYDTSAAGSSCIGDSSGILENGNCVASIASSGGTITYSSPTGSVNGDIALGHKNWWTGLQQFTNASSTLFEATSTVWLDNTKSALLVTDSNGKVGTYGGASACSSNNFVTTISALGATTCGTAAISGVNLGSNLNSLSVGSSLTGTSYNGSAAVSNWGLNLSNANTWTGNQMFLASTTIGASTAATGLTVAGAATTTNNIIVQGTATSTFGGALKLNGAMGVYDGSGTSTIQDTNGANITNGTHGIYIVPGSSTTTINFY